MASSSSLHLGSACDLHGVPAGPLRLPAHHLTPHGVTPGSSAGESPHVLSSLERRSPAGTPTPSRPAPR